MQTVKDALWLALGIVFVATLIPAALIVAGVALLAGRLERE